MRIMDLVVALIFFVASAGVAAFLMAVFINCGLGLPPAALKGRRPRFRRHPQPVSDHDDNDQEGFARQAINESLIGKTGGSKCSPARQSANNRWPTAYRVRNGRRTVTKG